MIIKFKNKKHLSMEDKEDLLFKKEVEKLVKKQRKEIRKQKYNF